MHVEEALLHHLRELEGLLTKPETRRCPAELDRLIADDFREFGGSGRVFDKAQIIAALQAQAPCEINLSDFRAIALAPGLALVTYRGMVRMTEPDRILHSLRSSIWRQGAGRWQVIFHQGTPAAEAYSGG